MTESSACCSTNGARPRSASSWTTRPASASAGSWTCWRPGSPPATARARPSHAGSEARRRCDGLPACLPPSGAVLDVGTEPASQVILACLRPDRRPTLPFANARRASSAGRTDGAASEHSRGRDAGRTRPRSDDRGRQALSHPCTPRMDDCLRVAKRSSAGARDLDADAEDGSADRRVVRATTRLHRRRLHDYRLPDGEPAVGRRPLNISTSFAGRSRCANTTVAGGADGARHRWRIRRAGWGGPRPP